MRADRLRRRHLPGRHLATELFLQNLHGLERVIDRRFENPKTSDLTITVKAEKNQIVLPVEKPKPKSK